MPVLLCADINLDELGALLQRYQLNLVSVARGEAIPGTFWKEPEAGLVSDTLYIREDTPVHSALHEACHFICMDQQRRQRLHTNAGGDAVEENGVCYLQILLADYLPAMGRQRMFADMDEWGYSFRLGSAQAWFEQDAEDALAWLQQHRLLNDSNEPCFRLRQN